MNKRIYLLLVGLLLLALAGCGAEPTPTPAAAQATAEPAPTETPVPTEEPTATEVPPTVPPTLEPTATQEPTEEPEPTAVPPTVAPEPTATVEEAAKEVALTVLGMDGSSVSLSMAELEELPQVGGWAGIKSSTGRIYPPRQISGVALAELVDLVGELGPDTAVRVQAEDGYAMTLSYEQVIGEGFVTYDPGTGDEKTVDEPLTLALAYAADGEPLDPQQDGTLRLVVASPEQNQVVDGHWSVKWVELIELQPVSAEWVLQLKGAIEEAMDRGTFESGAAPNCHGATWTDDEGNAWTGIPLWLLVGRVDDEKVHEGRAFNRQLADAGYTVEVVAADGYKVSFEIDEIRQDRDYIVAYLLNDEPLPEDSFPLRLVGPDLRRGQMVGQIAEIRLHLPEEGKAVEEPDEEATAEPTQEPSPEPTEAAAPTEEPAAAEAGEADLMVTGLVGNPLALGDAALQEMDVVEATVEHPKQGEQTYRGVRLNDLLDMAEPNDEAAAVAFVAGDGYSAEAPLGDVQGCDDCLLAFDDEPGAYRMVLPGFQSNVWVKGVVTIEVR
jgi:DMSO/TMAO reductase YedYZ molybdopterin-dependent catalytic subunit